MKRIFYCVTLTAFLSSGLASSGVQKKAVSDFCVITTKNAVIKDLIQKGWKLVKKTNHDDLFFTYTLQKQPEYKTEVNQHFTAFQSVPKCKVLVK